MPALVLRSQGFASSPGAADSTSLVFSGQFVATHMTIVFVGGDLFVELVGEFICHLGKVGHFCLQPAGNDCG